MSPSKRMTDTVDKLAKYHHQYKGQLDQDGAEMCSATEHQSVDTAKVLDAIATLQGTLTAKIDEVKIDIK